MILSDLPVPEKVVGTGVEEGKITIVPLGDLHVVPLLFADRAFKEHLEYVNKRFSNVYYLGMGDYVDVTPESNRTSIKRGGFYDTTLRAFDEVAEKRVRETLALLKGTEGRWLGMISGNHLWEFSTGGTSDDVLREELKAPDLGVCADIEVKFIRPDGKTRGTTGIWCHHGASYRKYPLGKLAELVGHFPKDDVFLLGHTHDCEFKYYPRIVRAGGTVVSRTALLAITGGWLKGYSEKTTTYIERKAKFPKALGGLVFTIEPTRIKGIFVPKFEVFAPSY